MTLGGDMTVGGMMGTPRQWWAAVTVPWASGGAMTSYIVCHPEDCQEWPSSSLWSESSLGCSVSQDAASMLAESSDNSRLSDLCTYYLLQLCGP